MTFGPIERPFSLRIGAPDDAGAVRACVNAAFTPFVAEIGAEPAPMFADHDSALAQGHVFVACDGTGAVVGVATAYAARDTMRFDILAVLPEVAGQGIGRALVAAVEQAAQQRGLGAVSLYTNVAMTGALRLYPRLGYRETGRRREDGYDRVYFHKSMC